MESKKINLKKGFVEVYNFENIKLHAYQTNDKNLLLIEFPAFYDNFEEFENYVKGLGKTIIKRKWS